jgi:hypothetical protein
MLLPKLLLPIGDFLTVEGKLSQRAQIEDLFRLLIHPLSLVLLVRRSDMDRHGFSHD